MAGVFKVFRNRFWVLIQLIEDFLKLILSARVLNLFQDCIDVLNSLLEIVDLDSSQGSFLLGDIIVRILEESDCNMNLCFNETDISIIYSHKFVIVNCWINVWDKDNRFCVSFWGQVSDHGCHFALWAVTLVWSKVSTLDSLRLKSACSRVFSAQLSLKLLKFHHHFLFSLVCQRCNIGVHIIIDDSLISKI